jgi:hypothetical protein
MAAAGPARTVAKTLRAALTRPAEPYMVAAAREIDAVLADHGVAVPLYLFGHTHVAADLPLRPAGARYLNPGSWSTFRPDGPHRDRLCVLEVTAAGDGRPGARLAHWDARRAERVPLPQAS